MLEVKHLTKIYRDKGGVETHALYDVSVRFGDTGLVFILGKSGCGKSTFLNIVGGLDTPTSGEVIVNGRSSRDFTQADFDSYRNTYIGFVFQEYNVLNEFTVEDNVALALELQSQKQVKDKVAEILREVDLEGFAKRKPNTLSGGQKQRIAIARALVKDPQIIMADEPTGALDSNTGRQVLDTLKSLSRTRLVIVVSHDRDFAESYGDRIIELLDGCVISDITKIHESPTDLDSNVKKIGGEILSIENGASLTEANYSAIRDFLASQGSVMIVSGDAVIRNTKTANRISEDNSRESFVHTDEAAVLPLDKQGAEKEDRLIRSRLPIGKAIKMGASSLKGHPVRLVFTILLSLVAFVVFGLLSCFMMYNGNTVAASTFASGDEEYLTLEKSYATYYTYTYYQQDNKQETKIKYNGSYFGTDDAAYFGMESNEVLYGCPYRSSFRSASLDSSLAGCTYYSLAGISKAMYVPEGNILRDDMTGTYPASADEIAVSTYLADYLLNCTVYSYEYDDNSQSLEEVSITPESYDDLIGLAVDDFTITGVINTGETPSKYDYMKETYAEEKDYDNFEAYLQDEEGTELGKDWMAYPANFAAYGEDSLDTIFIDGTSRTSLADDETVVTLYWLRSKAYADFISELKETYDEGTTDYMTAVDTFTDGRFDSEEDVCCSSIYMAMTALWTGSYDYTVKMTDTYTDKDGIEQTEEYYGYETKYVSAAERAELKETVNEYLTENPVTLTLCRNDTSKKAAVGTFKVVGYYTGLASSLGIGNYGMYLSENMFAQIPIYSHTEITVNYEIPDDAYYYYMIVPIQHKTSTWLRPIIKQLETPDDTGAMYSMANNLYDTILAIDDVMTLLIIIFLVAGIVFAAFAALLLFNFISVSIAGKQKEIGILRAVGAKGGDVFKIFFSESVIIVLICFILGVALTGVIVALVNWYIKSMYNIMVTLIVFTGWCVLMIFAIAAIVAFLGTFFPVYRASRKKPVESIRSL
ncbi:MAG: ATP-binding cassette domain-containing protein [Clostridia bacterium]|nr:ATP-binding cassette domain-containing protein [Clostridia bacterium]